MGKAGEGTNALKPCPQQKKSHPCQLNGRYNGKCRMRSVVYQLLIKSGSKTLNYFGQTCRSFHEQWMEHKRDMKNPDSTGTAFSNKVRELRNAGKSFDIETRIVRGAQTQL